MDVDVIVGSLVAAGFAGYALWWGFGWVRKKRKK